MPRTLDYQTPRTDPPLPGDFTFPRKVAIRSGLIAFLTALAPFLLFFAVAIFFPTSENAIFSILIPSAALCTISAIASVIALISGLIALRRGATGELIYPATIIGGVILCGYALVLLIAWLQW